METFYDENGKPSTVEMMNQKSDLRIFLSSDHNFEIIFIPLVQKYQYSAIVLPKERYNVRDVLKNFDIMKMKTYFFYSKLQYVDLKLPKIKIRDQYDFVEILNYFGLKENFVTDRPDFSRIMNEPVFIGNIIQVTNLNFDDHDEDASTPTMTDKSSELSYKFHVTKPFLYFVFSYSENIVYASAVVTRPNAA
ncbi:Alpha-2-antiplasmin [Thelohanellus kitauei]|uniref:Alpha-2-antiplasmin n=1 Tax=Thelohanellus kitauei TaxID=669202 RepID=A0A0C2I7Q9_THEKT|nr:Alpha-2-antiplasmin [Thelohanellus kitauei]